MGKILYNKNITKEELLQHNIVIDDDVCIGENVVIHYNVCILKRSVIMDGADVGSNSIIENSIIGKQTKILSSNIVDSKIGEGVSVGPFAHIRQNSVVGNMCRIGNFVETKNSVIGDRSKIAHLTYVGDGEIGNDCNIGCGVVFCNYDGKNKHKTVLKDRVFVGCNSNLIAPVCLEKESFVAAGTTVTNNLPANALAVGRVRQITKEKYKNNKYIKDK